MTTADQTQSSFDLMNLPGVGRFLRWRHARGALQISLLLIAVLVVFDGLTGPQLAPKNLATVLVWVHYRGLVVLALLLVGNLFCMACPFMLVRNLARRLWHPKRIWPSRWRNKWVAATLFVLMLFAYELFDLWASPRWTAWLILLYFAGALLVDSLFRGATFCKYLCPLGQFNFVSSLISPFEVRIQSPEPCPTCSGKDCIKARHERRLPGCELWLYQPLKKGNMDCTFCLDCAHACPHDNVGMSPRLPGSELWEDPQRSGIGRFSRRPDLALLIVVFTFGALLNALAMVTPVYELEAWLAYLLGTQSEPLVLGLIFLFGLLVLPAGLLAVTGWLAWRWGPAGDASLATSVTRATTCLVPLGFGVWLAHYSFHLLTGFWTFVPVIQSLVVDLAGTPVLGSPRWGLGPLLPSDWLYPLELGFLGLGWFGSLLVLYSQVSDREGRFSWGAFLPWAMLLTLLFAAAIWLMGQPMEMRGTFLVG